MKACLMRVNYEPRYTTPHLSTFESRLALTRDIYGGGNGSSQRQFKESFEEATAARRKIVLDSSFRSRKEGWGEDETQRNTRREDGEGRSRDTDTRDKEVRVRDKGRMALHKEGVAAAHSSIRSRNRKLTPPIEKTPGSYGDRLLKRQQTINGISSPSKSRNIHNTTMTHENTLHHIQPRATSLTLADVLNKKSPTVIALEKRARKEAERAIKDRKVFTILGPYHSLRAALRRRGWVEKFTNKFDDGNERNPWDEDNGFYGMMSDIALNCTPSFIFAVKTTDVEHCRRSGQLVNHFAKTRHFTTKSEVLQNVRPTLIYAVRSLDVESRSRHQIVNHYAKAGNFTTKMGLCQNLRAVPWYDTSDPDDFYPRCYNLDDDDERQSYIDDYRYTACIGFLKWFVEKYDGVTVGDEGVEESRALNVIVATSMMSTTQALGSESHTPVAQSAPATPLLRSAHDLGEVGGEGILSLTNNNSMHDLVLPKHEHVSSTTTTSSTPASSSGVASDHHLLQAEVTSDSGAGKTKHSLPSVLPQRSSTCCTADVATDTAGTSATSGPRSPAGSVMGRFLYHRSGKTMKLRYYHIAVKQCENLLKMKQHEDIDIMSDPEAMTDAQWDQFLTWFYTFVHEDADFTKVTGAMVRHCRALLDQLEAYFPQYTLDGCRNVWIIKPGAKSRGRGIQCLDRLDKILAMLADSDDKFVAQKYIERPFLVYNTKFDIRQWFLVTDWQPLTIWFYKSCYLRFCSQTFTLDDFHESIHLSNNSVQKNYDNNTKRSDKLPSDNMWTDEEFQDFLASQDNANVWADIVVPGMKSILTCSMLCTQELVEVRKSAFELYGADFMITEDFQPWLIEINSSPCMSRTTRATTILVDSVTEDTLKVVLDRRHDKNADTGLFQCIYKQTHVSEARPIDTDLTVTGRKIRKRQFNYTPHRGPFNRRHHGNADGGT